MRSTFLAFLMLGLIPSAQALSVYQARTAGEADRRVAIVSSIGEADVAIFRSSIPDSSRYVWYITRYSQDAEASIFFTSISFAQCEIIFVNQRGQAGMLRQTRGCFH